MGRTNLRSKLGTPFSFLCCFPFCGRVLRTAPLDSGKLPRPRRAPPFCGVRFALRPLGETNAPSSPMGAASLFGQVSKQPIPCPYKPAEPIDFLPRFPYSYTSFCRSKIQGGTWIGLWNARTPRKRSATAGASAGTGCSHGWKKGNCLPRKPAGCKSAKAAKWRQSEVRHGRKKAEIF